MSSNNNLESIKAIEELENLQFLEISFNQIKETESLGGLANLLSLNVTGNQIPLEHRICPRKAKCLF